MQKWISVIHVQERDVAFIAVHPSFNQANLYNDVALLHVESEFVLNEYVGTLCLPATVEDQAYQYDGCFATGWGRQGFGNVKTNLCSKLHTYIY